MTEKDGHPNPHDHDARRAAGAPSDSSQCSVTRFVRMGAEREGITAILLHVVVYMEGHHATLFRFCNTD